MAMALLSDMRRIRGIEMLEGLVEASRSVCDKWQTFIESDEVEIEIDSDEDAEEQQQAGGDGAKKKRTIVHSPLTKLERKANAPQEDRVQFVQGEHAPHRARMPRTAAATAAVLGPALAVLSRSR
jgi:hypothetical protein